MNFKIETNFISGKCETMEINKTELLRVFDFKWENPKHEQAIFVIKIYKETKIRSEELSNPESK